MVPRFPVPRFQSPHCNLVLFHRRLHFIEEKVKVNAKYYAESLLPSLVADCNSRFEVDSAFNKTVPRTHCISTDLGLPPIVQSSSVSTNGPQIHRTNSLDFHVWSAMFDLYHKYQPHRTNISELKVALQSIWNDLPQDPIDRSILSFSKRLRACIKANGGHFEYRV